METSAAGSMRGSYPFDFLLMQKSKKETTAPYDNVSFSQTLSARLLCCPALFFHALLCLLFCPLMTNTKPVQAPFSAVSKVHSRPALIKLDCAPCVWLLYVPICMFWIQGLAKQRALLGTPQMLCSGTSEGEVALEGK